jgi:hypothetical protein
MIKGTDFKLIVIQVEHDYLLMDTAKWYFTRLGVDQINDCKIVSKVHKICKQTQPVQLTHLEEECGAQMIEPIKSIPASC